MKAAKLFNQALTCDDQYDNQNHKQFLEERPISLETINKWMIGYLPSHILWRFPFLRGRIICPVFDSYGDIIAFTGRKLEKNKNIMLANFFEDFKEEGIEMWDKWYRAKWINEPYDKKNHLFGLYQNKHNIVKKQYAIIVEGNYDVVTLDNFGVNNAVATCGTTFSKKQASLLLRYTKNLVIMTDSDQAGDKLTDRILGKDDKDKDNLSALFNSSEFFRKNMIVRLPAGYDPEDYARAFGGVRISKIIEQGLEKDAKEIAFSLKSNRILGIEE
jgi:DNA primase